MKKIIIALFALGFLFFTEDVKAEVNIKSKDGMGRIEISSEGDTIKLDFKYGSPYVEFYYVNACKKEPNVEIDCNKAGNYYSYILPKQNTVKIPIQSEGNFQFLIGSKNIDHTYSYHGEVEFTFSNPTYMSSSYIVNTEDPIVKSIVENEFKGYEDWTTLYKTKKVNEYIVNNFTYDRELLNSDLFKSGAIYPDYKRISERKMGICYDLASLFVALLRAMDVPASLSIGDVSTSSGIIYHAWVTVETHKGIERIIDPTFSLPYKSYIYRDAKLYDEHFRY